MGPMRRYGAVLLAVLTVLSLIAFASCAGHNGDPTGTDDTTKAADTDDPTADTAFVPKEGIEYSPRLLAVYYDGKWNNGFRMEEEDVKAADMVYYLSLYVMTDDEVELSNDKLTAEAIAEAKAINPALKVLVTLVGDNRDGKNGSRQFANAVSNAEKRAELCRRVCGVIAEYGFDGADINWEYPQDANDRTNEVLFARELRLAMRRENKEAVLTAAVPATMYGFDTHDIVGLVPELDYLNVMTYDYHINDSETLHHTAPRNDGTGKYQDRGYSNEQTTQMFIENGVPAKKMILGCGLYTLEWSDVAEGDTHGFNTVGVRVPNHTYHYKELESLCRGSFTRYWDVTAGAPYYYSAEHRTFLSCDDDESVRIKAELVQEYDNAGLMLFSYYTLRGNTLMQSVRHWLNGELTYPAAVDWSKYTGGTVK